MVTVAQQLRADNGSDSGVGTLTGSASDKSGVLQNYEGILVSGTTTITLGSPNGSPV